MTIGLDFETYSDVDIKRHGLDRYMSDPSFTVLLGCVADQDDIVDVFDFIFDGPNEALSMLRRRLRGEIVSAHNASFERGVLKFLGIDVDQEGIVILDSAVIARAMGAAGKLEAAVPQLLVGREKVELGAHLIQIFCVPTKENKGRPYTMEEIISDMELHEKWLEFRDYCAADAMLSREIVDEYEDQIRAEELLENELVTQRMNDIGWFVDIAAVQEMHRRYKINVTELETSFRFLYDDPANPLNVNSYQQLQKWCAERGVRAKSFDQLHVNKLLLRLRAKLQEPAFLASVQQGDSKACAQTIQYGVVIALLELKQELGGSSLSKLQTILDQVGPGNRLRGQYLHIGAGQSYRTTGRGVQMQNLPRLEEQLGAMEELTLYQDMPWTNAKLARNIRQCFMAENETDLLIVGDFKSIESRGLAYLAGENWKLEAYRQDKDMYKMLATTFQSFGGVEYDQVTKKQRQAGKVGELACGYGAGPQAVADFAEKMGILMSVQEAGEIVHDWRDANPEIVRFWYALDNALHQVVENDQSSYVVLLPHDKGKVIIQKEFTPDSLKKQHPGAQSIKLVVERDGELYLSRFFHGCYMRGRDVCYYKPSELKSGDLWRARMNTPPHAWYKLYGGKLAGILTQSFCREMFFDALRRVDAWTQSVSNVRLIGQFHDEIVLEWTDFMQSTGPAWTMADTVYELDQLMSQTIWTDFPIATDVQSARRYIK